MTGHYDVLIAGGGLAGLTLARQLKRELPSLSIFVAEKRQHPVSEAAFKVGESSVEVGAHYFHKVLGLDQHLRDGHLEKLGIRYFFPFGSNSDLARRVEVGPRNFPPVPSFQIDRGRLENYLLQTNREVGIDVVDGCTVSHVHMGSDRHALTVSVNGSATEVTGRWLVDASGRTGLVRRMLGLTQPVGHAASASWFRIGRRVNVDDWASDSSWVARVPSRQRWLSTNHLMGRGYWVWLIPLGSGSTSVGIVVDSTLHAYERINRADRAVDWLREFEPQCARIVESEAGNLQDFLALKNYAYGCKRVFSTDRWLLTGEAGVFTDPFYSPGSDFIAISNDCIAEIITRDFAGQDVTAALEAMNTTYLRLFDAFLRLYEGQYRLMGNAQVMSIKAAWDNACYWAVSGLLYFQRRYRDPPFMASIDPLMRRFLVLHARMQAMLRAWDVADTSVYADAWLNVLSVESLRELQASLGAPRLEDPALRTTLHNNFRLLERFAQGIVRLAEHTSPEAARLLPPTGAEDPLDISALTLMPKPITSAALS